jgi:DNA-binding NarL/FixJ family response regulator
MTKILVVEDEPSFSDALAYLLGREGFEVIVADSGPKAIEEFDRHGADLVLLDLMLPGISGTEVCRQFDVAVNTVGAVFHGGLFQNLVVCAALGDCVVRLRVEVEGGDGGENECQSPYNV